MCDPCLRPRFTKLASALAVVLIGGEGLGCGGESAPGAAAPPPADTPDPITEPALADPGPSPRGPAFAGVEALRPRAWASWPVENVDLRGYDGWRIDPVHGGFERARGLRFATETGVFVLAIADGEVGGVTRDTDDRLVVRVDHEQGISSHYGPLSDALVHEGLPLQRGAALGLAAGDALDLRVTIDGLDVDPLLILRQPLHRWPALLRLLPPPTPP